MPTSPVVPQDDSQESLPRHALGEIKERFRQSVQSSKDDIAPADPHPELTKFVTAYISCYINHALFDIEMTIWVHERKAIMKLMGEEKGKQLVMRRLEVAREGRKRKQAERRQRMHKRGLRLQNWRDKLDPPSPSPQAQADIPVILLEDAVLDADVGYGIEEETPKTFMEEFNRLGRMQPGDTTNRKFTEFSTVLQFAFLLSSTSQAALRLVRCDYLV
jgi:hypothetical protein